MSNFISEGCKKNINFDYILSEVKPITKYGQIIKDTTNPFLPGQENELMVELKKVEAFLNMKSRTEQKNILKEIRYIQETFQRAKNNVVLDIIELFEVKKFIIYCEKLEKSLRGTFISTYKDLIIKPLPDLQEALDPTHQKLITFYIYDEYTCELKEIRNSKKQVEQNIRVLQKNIKADLEQEYDVKFNLRDEITISKSQSEKIEELTKNDSLRVSGENYLSIVLKLKNNENIDRLEKELEVLKHREELEELKVRETLSKLIKASYDDLVKNSEIVGRIDYLIAKADYAQETNSVFPQITEELRIDIKNGRNLKLENTLKEKNKEYTPISVLFNKNVVCITGANMGGKTVSLRMIGQIITAVAYGMFVPCERAKVCLFNHIHISVGDDQSIEKGLSTFGAEIVNLKKALENSNERSLILIDELAGGTNPKEGYAITKSVVCYLKKKDCLSIFTTHYDNIANDKEIQNFQVSGLKLPQGITKFSNIDEISKYMDYSLIEIKEDSQIPKDAINIAKMAGIPDEIISQAIKLVEIVQ